MKRLLLSSRFQALVAAVVTCVAIAAGASDEKADELAVALVAVIGVLTSILIGGTSLEDAAAKKGAPLKPPGPGRSTLSLLLAGTAALTAAGNLGCAMFAPGYDSATAMKQKGQFGWDASGNFATNFDGSQTGAFTMAEGDLVLRDDGTVDPAASRLAYYLTYTPRADDAASAYARALKTSEEQSRQAFGMLQSVILAAMLRPQATAEQTAADQLAGLVEALDRLRVGAGPPAEEVVEERPRPPATTRPAYRPKPRPTTRAGDRGQ